MVEKTHISNYQAFLLILFTHVPTAVFFVPGTAVNFISQDAWISIIIATIIAALFVIYPIADLGMRYPGKTIIEYSESILGKFLGKTLGLVLIYWFFQFHCWTLREFAEVAMIFLPETPILFITIFFALIIAYACFYGIEVIGRCAEFVFPLGLFSFFIIILSTFTKLDFSQLFPAARSGILPIIRASIHPLDWLSISFLFGVIASFVRNQKDLKKIGLTAIGSSGFILTLFSILVILVLGISILKITTFPLISLARYGEFPTLERIEIFVIVPWVTWVFIRGALVCFCTLLGLSQLFNLKDYRFLIIPETILAIAYSIYQYSDLVELSYLFSVGTLFYESIQIGIPFTLWIIAITQRSNTSNKEVKE